MTEEWKDHLERKESMIKREHDQRRGRSSVLTIVSSSKAEKQAEASEDYVLVDRRRGLVGVFDGIGGRGNGRLAARVGAQTIHARWKDLAETIQTQIESVLQELIKEADEQVSLLEVPADQRRPATTVALAVLIADREGTVLSSAHVGDSRIYLLREGQGLQRLTEDHGYFSFACQKGWVGQEEALRIEQATEETRLSETDLGHFRKRNKITCGVGWKDFSAVPTHSIELVLGDRIVLCTDGIHDNLTDQEIASYLGTGQVRTSAQRLVRAAYRRSQQGQRRSKPDDMSALIIDYGEHAGIAMRR